MKTLQAFAVIALLALALAACGEPPQVVQGTVVQYQAETQTLVLQDETPGGPALTLSLQGAEIGAEPAVGDLVRVAYRDAAGSLTAVRVMNLTRQKELGQSGGGH